jgi:hypothetical protein
MTQVVECLHAQSPRFNPQHLKTNKQKQKQTLHTHSSHTEICCFFLFIAVFRILIKLNVTGLANLFSAVWRNGFEFVALQIFC